MGSLLSDVTIRAAPCWHDSGIEIALGQEFDLAIVRQHEAVRQLGLDLEAVFVSGIYADDGDYVFMVCHACGTN